MDWVIIDCVLRCLNQSLCSPWISHQSCLDVSMDTGTSNLSSSESEWLLCGCVPCPQIGSQIECLPTQHIRCVSGRDAIYWLHAMRSVEAMVVCYVVNVGEMPLLAQLTMENCLQCAPNLSFRHADMRIRVY